MSMHAAVVPSFDNPPRYETYDAPEPTEPGETVVDVLAVGLHPESAAAPRASTTQARARCP